MLKQTKTIYVCDSKNYKNTISRTRQFPNRRHVPLLNKRIIGSIKIDPEEAEHVCIARFLDGTKCIIFNCFGSHLFRPGTAEGILANQNIRIRRNNNQ